MTDISDKIREAFLDEGIFQDPLLEDFQRVVAEAEEGEQVTETRILGYIINGLGDHVNQPNDLTEFVANQIKLVRGSRKKGRMSPTAQNIKKRMMALRALTKLSDWIRDPDLIPDTAQKEILIEKLKKQKDSVFKVLKALHTGDDRNKSLNKIDLVPDNKPKLKEKFKDAENKWKNLRSNYISSMKKTLNKLVQTKEPEETDEEEEEADEDIRQLLGTMEPEDEFEEKPTAAEPETPEEEELEELSPEEATQQAEQEIAKRKQAKQLYRGREGTFKQDPGDVEILQKGEDKALARIKGKTPEGKIEYKHLIVSKAQLAKVVGDDYLSPINIHNYIHKINNAYQKKKAMLDDENQVKRLKKNYHNLYVADPRVALTKFQGEKEKPESFKEYLRQKTGKDAKSGILNALQNLSASQNATNYDPKALKWAFSLVMSMNDQIIEALLDRVDKGQGKLKTPDQKDVLAHLVRMQRTYSAIMESREEDKSFIVEQSSVRQLLNYLGGKIKGALTPEDYKLAKRDLLYTRLAGYIVSNPKEVATLMAKSGLRVPNAPKGLLKPTPEEAVESPEDETEAEEGDRRAEVIHSSPLRRLVNIIRKPSEFDKWLKEHPDLINREESKKISRFLRLLDEDPVKAGEYIDPRLGSEASELFYKLLILQKKWQKLQKQQLRPEIQRGFNQKKFKTLQKIVYDKKSHTKLLDIIRRTDTIDRKKEQEFRQLLLALRNKDENSIKEIEQQNPGIIDELTQFARAVIPGLNEEEFRLKYASLIVEDEKLEEHRLLANDLAHAALDLYVNRCNELNRIYTPKMYDDHLQSVFDDLMLEANRAFDDYQNKLEEHDLNYFKYVINENDNDLFYKLVYLACLTEDPLDRSDEIVDYIKDPDVVTESYHRSMINPVNKQEYVPISNII